MFLPLSISDRNLSDIFLHPFLASYRTHYLDGIQLMSMPANKTFKEFNGPVAQIRRQLLAGSKFGIWPITNRYSIDTSQTGTDYHGTMVASKVVGKTCGAAKKADLVTVKLPVGINRSARLYASAVLDGFTKILNDVRATKRNRLTTRGFVLNMSFGGPLDTNTGSFRQMSKMIDKLIAEDVVIVTASGNCRMPRRGVDFGCVSGIVELYGILIG